MVKGEQEEQVPLQYFGDQELISHTLVTVFTEFFGELWLIQESANLQARPLHGMNEHPGIPMYDLRRNPSDITADHWTEFPEGL